MLKVNNYKIFYAAVLVFLTIPAYTQMEKGRTAIGSEFSFLNSKNEQSTTNFAFSEELKTGFNFSLLGGKFINKSIYMFGIADLNYNSSTRINESLQGSKEASRSINHSTTIGLGGGARKYFTTGGRVGFFIQGNAIFARTLVRAESYFSAGDSVFNDVKLKYPFYSLNLAVNPGVYCNLGRHWQLTFNLGELYFIQTWVPEKEGQVAGRRNASFGMNVNLFDFKVGALYFLGKTSD